MSGAEQKLSPREYRATLRKIVRRDYFPASSSEPSQGEHVEEFVARNKSIEHESLQKLMKQSKNEHERIFGKKKTSYLRPIEASAPLLKDKKEESEPVSPKKPEIARENARFEAPKAPTTRRSLLRRAERQRDDLDLISVTSRSTTRSTLRASKPMSEAATGLMESIQQQAKKRNKAQV